MLNNLFLGLRKKRVWLKLLSILFDLAGSVTGCLIMQDLSIVFDMLLKWL